jgi:hypothetical protein
MIYRRIFNTRYIIRCRRRFRFRFWYQIDWNEFNNRCNMRVKRIFRIRNFTHYRRKLFNSQCWIIDDIWFIELNWFNKSWIMCKKFTFMRWIVDIRRCRSSNVFMRIIVLSFYTCWNIFVFTRNIIDCVDIFITFENM